jgi:ABC-type transporter Mla subunit MlaD
MGQTTFEDDDELFGEATNEIREDVQAHLREARAKLPTADAIWSTDADNILGALNGLRSGLDTGDAAESLRQARKQYVLGERAGAFDEDDDLGDELDEVAALVETLNEAHEQVGELTSTVPQLRSQLEDAHEEGADAGTSGDGEEAEA